MIHYCFTILCSNITTKLIRMPKAFLFFFLLWFKMFTFLFILYSNVFCFWMAATMDRSLKL